MPDPEDLDRTELCYCTTCRKSTVTDAQGQKRRGTYQTAQVKKRHQRRDELRQLESFSQLSIGEQIVQETMRPRVDGDTELLARDTTVAIDNLPAQSLNQVSSSAIFLSMHYLQSSSIEGPGTTGGFSTVAWHTRTKLRNGVSFPGIWHAKSC